MKQPTPLALVILLSLAEMPETTGMSLPRLGKRTGQSASVLMRELSLMSDATIGGAPGRGWVQVQQIDGRWSVHITAAGRAVAASQKR